jgi:hypothetical protein
MILPDNIGLTFYPVEIIDIFCSQEMIPPIVRRESPVRYVFILPGAWIFVLELKEQIHVSF